MPLDPQARLLLDQMASMGTPPLHTMSVPDARTMMESMNGLLGEGDAVAHVEDRQIPGPADAMPARLYRPDGKGPLPLLVYFHGGGWVLGGLASHDVVCRALANASGCALLAIDYRLAPEHVFPRRSTTATRRPSGWSQRGALGADPARVAIGGDSAGGNLTAVVAQLAAIAAGRRSGSSSSSIRRPMPTPTPVVSRERHRLFPRARRHARFYDHYLPRNADRRPARHRCAPPISRAPPALVITAEFDRAAREEEAYAARLRKRRAGHAHPLPRDDPRLLRHGPSSTRQAGGGRGGDGAPSRSATRAAVLGRQRDLDCPRRIVLAVLQDARRTRFRVCRSARRRRASQRDPARRRVRDGPDGAASTSSRARATTWSSRAPTSTVSTR